MTYINSIPDGGWTNEHRTTKLVLRRIEPGTIKMGDQAHGSSPILHISLTRPYYMGIFEVTQRQWELVLGTRPSFFSNNACYAMRPVEKVSYDMIRGRCVGANWPKNADVDDDSFLGILRRKTKLPLDLPTEAQWEHACRAGTTTDYNNGTNYSADNLETNLAGVARFDYNSGYSSHPIYSQSDVDRGTATVGSYLPNAWGLYDMHGNVLEWCLDWKAPLTSGVKDPAGTEGGTHRVLRGGCWDRTASAATAWVRERYLPSCEYNMIGIRVCCPDMTCK